MIILIHLLFLLQFTYIYSTIYVFSPDNITKIYKTPHDSKDILVFLNGTYNLQKPIGIKGGVIVADNDIVEITCQKEYIFQFYSSQKIFMKGQFILKDSNGGIYINNAQEAEIEGIKIYNMTEYGIKCTGNSVSIKNSEIMYCGKGILLEKGNKVNITRNIISNNIINFYIKSTYINFFICNNIIYNSTYGIYSENTAGIIIANNIIVNNDNAISIGYIGVKIYIIYNVIFNSKKSVINIRETKLNNIRYNPYQLMNNFIDILDKDFLKIGNLDYWNISNNFFYNCDNISSNYANQSIFYKGELDVIFSNYQGRCNYSTQNGDIHHECFRPNKWNKGKESLYEGGVAVYLLKDLFITNDYENKTRPNEATTIGAFENPAYFDSAIEISINYCIYERDVKMNVFGKLIKKLFGEFIEEGKCLWKYTFTEIPDFIKYYFVLAVDESIVKWGKAKKMNKTELIDLSLNESGQYDECYYKLDKSKNIYSFKCQFR